MNKEDINSMQYSQMKVYNDAQEDLPNGAFFALAEQMYGWDSGDWLWFSELQDIDKDY